MEIAKNKPTKLSSNMVDTHRLSQNVVDGDYTQWMTLSSEFCSETSVGNDSSWWAVDLGAIYEISNVGIYCRSDCCGMFNIFKDAFRRNVPFLVKECVGFWKREYTF